MWSRGCGFASSVFLTASLHQMVYIDFRRRASRAWSTSQISGELSTGRSFRQPQHRGSKKAVPEHQGSSYRPKEEDPPNQARDAEIHTLRPFMWARWEAFMNPAGSSRQSDFTNWNSQLNDNTLGVVKLAVWGPGLWGLEI